MLPTKFCFFWPSGFRGEDFLDIDQSETIIADGSHVFKIFLSETIWSIRTKF
jgi:hypothetical protein